MEASAWSAAERRWVKEAVDELRRNGGRPIVHGVFERTSGGRSRRELVVVLGDEPERLALWGCRVGAPPAHEAGGGVWGDYDRVLGELAITSDWTEREKNAIRTFIAQARRAR